ncbi:MAG: phosphotransferase enzyme family protein [Lachnospiraceae bacterium]
MQEVFEKAADSEKECAEKLPTPDEIRSRLGSVIFDLFDLPEDTKVFHLKYSENFTYRLESPGTGKKYVLRVNRPGYHSIEELKSELVWMKALREDTDIFMADVIAGKNGQYLQQLDFPNTSESYVCTLFSFLEGVGIRGMEQGRLVACQEEIGRISAMMHLHVMKWNPDNRLPRFSWDLEDLFGENCRWGDYSLNPFVSDEEKKILTEAVEIGIKRIKEYGKECDRYGLIHSDLNINNILVEGSQVKVLDFDDCGYGWFLYDLATSVLEYDETLEEMVQAWLRGYESVRKLSLEDLAEIPTFIVLRKIVRMGWIATHLDNDTVKRVDRKYYEETVKLAANYIKNQR